MLNNYYLHTILYCTQIIQTKGKSCSGIQPLACMNDHEIRPSDMIIAAIIVKNQNLKSSFKFINKCINRCVSTFYSELFSNRK